MKSILVIETPKACRECRLLDDDNWYCMGYHEACDLSGISNRPSWCPLKPMPKSKPVGDIEEIIWDNDTEVGYNCGWNACLKEIEK